MSVRTKDVVASDIFRETAAARDLIAALQSDDEAVRRDMIEGETSLFEAIDAALSEIDECEVMIAGCAAKISEFDDRKRRAAARSERLRGLIEQALVVADVTGMKLATATLSIKRVPPKPIYDDESKIPAAFWRQPDPVLDRAAILAAFKDGQSIPGVSASNGGVSLQIRRS